MKSKSIAFLSMALVTAAAISGCQQDKSEDFSNKDKGRHKSGRDEPAISMGYRAGATLPVTRYQSSKVSGEICDYALSAPCANAAGSNVELKWHNNPDNNMLTLNSGLVVVQGTFPPTQNAMAWPVPWPIIVTTRVTIGSEGTTFAVYTDTDSNGKQEDIIFLYDGGPLCIAALNAPAPPVGTEDAQHRRLVANPGFVMYSKAYIDPSGQVVLTPAAKVDPGEVTVGNAFKCVEAVRKGAKLDQPLPPTLSRRR